MIDKKCEECGSKFSIDDKDKAYYKKTDVPLPRKCPDCRMKHLMSFRNERNIYRRKCDFSGKEILSIYPPDSGFKIYEQGIWWSDKWDEFEYGRDFDFSRTFFEQIKDIYKEVPRMNLEVRNMENSTYCNDCNDLKNCYLCFNAADSQDSYYCNTYVYSRDSMDMFWCMNCELCYECTKLMGGYNCFWCFNSTSLSDCYFCEECMGCKNCFGCIGLRQKEYCVHNKQLSKEEYEKFISDYKFTHQNIELAKQKVRELSLKVPHKNLEINQSEDSMGDYISNSKNCIDCFDMMYSQDCRYVWDGMLNDSNDCYNCGGDETQGACNYLYNSMAIYYSTNVKFSHKCSTSSDLLYSVNCYFCDSCFGCISLRHKKYCILNKQYTKEEYGKLLPKIIGHMRKTGEYGKFFPKELSGTGYDNSMADYHFPLEKKEALSKGFIWNDYKNPEMGRECIEAENLPSEINETKDEIIEQAIRCEKDGRIFKIIPTELKFYKKHNIPIPHLCADCRHLERKRKMNPRKLWERNCDKCGTEIKTTYNPKRPEKVYCEKCYLKEVY